MPLWNLLMIPLIIFLNSCRSNEISYLGEQCSPVFSYVDDTKKFIDVDASYCNSRLYQMNIVRVGPVQGTTTKKPLSYCDRCVGFKDYDSFIGFAEEVRVEINGEIREGQESIVRETSEPIRTGQD